MTEADHADLLDALLVVKGKVLLSSYPNRLYEDRLRGWNRVDFDIANHAASGGTKRRMTECVWMNFEPATSAAACFE
jgi:DNA adenine methylase